MQQQPAHLVSSQDFASQTTTKRQPNFTKWCQLMKGHPSPYQGWIWTDANDDNASVRNTQILIFGSS